MWVAGLWKQLGRFCWNCWNCCALIGPACILSQWTIPSFSLCRMPVHPPSPGPTFLGRNRGERSWKRRERSNGGHLVTTMILFIIPGHWSRIRMHRITGRRRPGSWITGIIQGRTGNGVKGIPGNRVTALHCIIIPGHCFSWFHSMRLAGVWIMDPMETTLMQW